MADQAPSPSRPEPSWLERLFLIGPDPPDRPKETTPLDTLLSWPVRLSATAGLATVGFVWASSPGGLQLGWALQYSLLVAVSIAAAHWFPLFVVNLSAALAWLAVSYWPRLLPPGGRRFVKWVNRQMGHVEAGAIWTTVALVSSHELARQLTGVGVVVFLGAPLLNGVARLRSKEARQSRVALHRERRTLIYLATLVGLAVLALLAIRQIDALVPLFVAVLPGLAVRYLRAWLSGTRRFPDRTGTPESIAAEDMRELKIAQSTGWIAPLMVLGAFGAVIGLSIWQQAKMKRAEATTQDGPPLPTDACVPEQGGPLTPTLAVFLLADSQIHDLGHKRFPGQMEVASALVPVARRPVELDLLSTAAIVRYRSVFGQIQTDRAKAGLASPFWAHLGDLADLSCDGEMTWMTTLLKSFPGQEFFAGVAPGNHDSTFQGNFDWSPYWDEACGTGNRLEKEGSDQQLKQLLPLGGKAFTNAISTWRLAANPFRSTPAARWTVTPLGTVPAMDGERKQEVVGIFVDTTDRIATNHGIAGKFGSFSAEQREEIAARVQKLRSSGRQSDPPDPAFIIFSHVPYDELAAGSQREFANLVATLDQPPAGCRGKVCDRARVIGLVSAHTHVAGSHRYCMSQRLVREIVVGSVIDPPEQASLLEIGRDARGRLSMRLSTLPSIGREGLTCSSAYAIPAAHCRSVLAKLTRSAECTDLVSRTVENDQPATCESLEQELSLAEQIDSIARHGGPDDPDQLALADKKRAQALIRCLCRSPHDGSSDGGAPDGGAAGADSAATAPPVSDGGTSVTDADVPPRECPQVVDSPLDGGYGPLIEQLTDRRGRQEELTCLAWAAAALQEHKANGMTIAEALRCAFDDPTLPPAQATVATLAEQSCR